MAENYKVDIPKISIGMPVYNGEMFIREALDSLLSQTFADFELIISDNASTDATESICREYVERDQRIRYVRQCENTGAVANFQFVLNEAVGEYFMWAAADDIWDNKWIESLLPVSSAHQCLAYGFVHTIDTNGEETFHAANCRKFEFTGNRLYRRLKYYMEPGFLGKANPIYGIFPIKTLREGALSILDSENKNADMIFLYFILNKIEIRHAGCVFLYKRIHNACAGYLTIDTEKPDILSKILKFLYIMIFDTIPDQYIRQSDFIQSAFIIALYPVRVVYTAACAIYYKIRRVLRDR